MIAITGVRPTGELHIGNYFGAIKPLLNLQDKYNLLLFVADLHSFTTNLDLDQIKENTLKLISACIALGFNPEKNILWIQSDVPEVCQVMYILSSVTGFQFLHKGHAFKAACADNKHPSVALFLYPVLMAADILTFQADVVPVGEDQKQHIEICRDLAEKLKTQFDIYLKIPEALILEATGTVPGIDGRKMSKSYNNTLPIFASPDEIAARISRIKTDSTPLGSPISLDSSILGFYLSLLCDESTYQDIKNQALGGNLGWGKIKELTTDFMVNFFHEARVKYQELISDPKNLFDIVRNGSALARSRAKDFLHMLMKRVRIYV